MPGSAWGSPGGLETEKGSEYGYAASATSYGAETSYTGEQQRGGTGIGGNGHGMREKAGRMAEQARGNLSRATEETRTRMSQWSRSARSQASQAADRTWEAYQEHPITMGAVAVLLGAALGAILPRSRTEEEVMGPQARQAMRQARAAAGDLAEKAGQVASTAVERAKEEAKGALQGVTEATKDEAERQGLTGSTSSSMTH